MKNIITYSNIKLGGLIAQINMPYCVSCRPDAPCYKDCYCNHGNMAFSTTRKAHMKRYEEYLNNPVAFFIQLDKELTAVTPKHVRWHASGDIPDIMYLDMMCKLARHHKDIKFLCFSKKYELVNEYLDTHRKPSNLSIVLSNWGDWVAENPHNLPTSWVEFGCESDAHIPAKATKCSGHCGTCVNAQSNCWDLKKGQSVYFHKH